MYNLLLDWTPSTDNVGVTGYALLINGVAIDVGDNTTYLVEAEEDTEYEFYVRAYDAAGNKSSWAGPYRPLLLVVEGNDQVVEMGETVLEG